MEKVEVKISYWTYPEGGDFEDIKSFKADLSKEYKSEFYSEPTDAMGGGLYEFVVEARHFGYRKLSIFAP